MYWGIAGIIFTFFIYYLQKQRGRFKVSLNIEIEPFSKRNEGIYQNSEATKKISINTKVKSNHSRPIFIDSFFLAIPAFQWFYKPHLISIYWPFKTFITIEFGNLELPHKLEPTGEISKQFITGLKVANNLSEHGFKNNVNVLIGFFDDNKNPYYSDPFLVEIEEWKKDSGRLLVI
jgi:hypothetical protein